MKLFSRRAVLAGPPTDVMAFAVDITHHVTATVGREVALWSALFGAPQGAMVWSARVEGIADLAASNEALMADATYLDKAAAGQKFQAAPTEDSIASPVLGELGDESPPVGSYATVTTAQMNETASDALAWSVDVAQHVTAATGVPVGVLTSQYGPFGTVAWIASMPTAADVDRFNEQMAGDEGYIKRLDAAGGLFVPGSGTQVLLRRDA